MGSPSVHLAPDQRFPRKVTVLSPPCRSIDRSPAGTTWWQRCALALDSGPRLSHASFLSRVFLFRRPCLCSIIQTVLEGSRALGASSVLGNKLNNSVLGKNSNKLIDGLAVLESHDARNAGNL